MADIPRIRSDEVVRHFEELRDPRSTVNPQHPLVGVIVIALLTVLAGDTRAMAGPQDGGTEPAASPPRVAALVQPAQADSGSDAPAEPTAPRPVDSNELRSMLADAVPNDDIAPGGGGNAGLSSVSGNPAATNILAGTGALGRFLGFHRESGIRLGGFWIGDGSGVLAGGREPGAWAFNSLTVVDLSFDTEKLVGWRGGMFDAQFLQFTGQPTNSLAGAFPGFNSLEVTPPLVRQELYQLWYRQSMFDDRLIVRIGKLVPTYDFGNVVKPATVGDPTTAIPAVSGLIYTPIFVNPTMLGVIPGYYNSAAGLTVTVAPTDRLYLSYGFYDGNGALGRQTGLEGPHFNGYYFHIGEVGYSYRAGPQRKPGNIGVGLWGQTGMLRAVDNAMVPGAQGVYLFGTRRLWFRRPGRDSSGVSGFYQFGANNTNALLAREYFGTGLTAFGLVPGRPDDSFGWGLSLTWLNTSAGAGRAFFPESPAATAFLRPSQLMFAWYYQWKVFDGCFFQPNLTYIPTPGEGTHIPGALAATFRLVVLF